MTDTAIGGYMALELPAPAPMRYPQALQFQSARAAFLALLRTGKPRRVWMPRYMCDAMLAPLAMAGCECVFYSVSSTFEIADPIELAPGDWLLYVNYMGVCGDGVQKVLRTFDPAQVVLDHSQAFFAPPGDCLATVYSPRKFFGVPDGGLLVTTLPVVLPQAVDEGAPSRMAHLLKRLYGQAESGYADFQQAEQSLEACEPCRMSPLTQRILGGIDTENARHQRNHNFALLYHVLGPLNRFPLDVTEVDGPLCYPFLCDQPGLRERLIAARIFVPTYWPDVLGRVDGQSWEATLVRKLIPLPCDQRYGEAEMGLVAELCRSVQPAARV